MNNIAYSYVRFSSLRQAKGSSVVRQLEATQRYCDQHQLTLSTLTFRDLGVSAFKTDQNNLKGGFGLFLNAVQNGDIAAGSTLIVESLDRINRQEPTVAFTLLVSIVNSGISVVTLADQQLYTRENINDPSKLFVSLGIMLRAYDESKTKSMRSLDNWKRIKKKEQAGLATTKMCQWWLQRDGDKYILKQEHIPTLAFIFEQYANGIGYSRIAKKLNADGVPTPLTNRGTRASMWHIQTIKKLIHNRALIGEHNGIDNYYPAAIPLELFVKANAVHSTKKSYSMGGKSGQKNILQNLVHCSKCGNTLVRIRRRNGKHAFVCNAGRISKNNCTGTGWDTDVVCKLVVLEIKELNINALFNDVATDTITKNLNDTLEVLQANLTNCQMKRKRIIAAIEKTDDEEEVDDLMIRRKELKQEETDITANIKSVEQQLHDHTALQSEMISAKNNVVAMRDYSSEDNIIRINTELKKIISGIKVDTVNKIITMEYKTGMIKQIELLNK